jgi:transposase
MGTPSWPETVGETQEVDLVYGIEDFHVLEEAPLSGHVFLFANGARTRLKVLVWDGSGLWVCTKKLGRGRYAWPTVGEGESRRVRMSQSELMLLLSGVDLAATKRREWWRKE